MSVRNQPKIHEVKWHSNERHREVWVDRWAGLQKLITDLDMRNGHKEGVRVGFIYINDMYNNDVGKGVVYAYEAYEVK